MKEELKHAVKVVEGMISGKVNFPVCIRSRLGDFPEGDDRMSFYKEKSQIRSEPTIIVNKNITRLMVMREIPMNMLETIIENALIREFVQSIVEYGNIRDVNVKKEIEKNFEDVGKFNGGFLEYIRTDKDSILYDPVMQSYGKSLEDLYSFSSSCKIVSS